VKIELNPARWFPAKASVLSTSVQTKMSTDMTSFGHPAAMISDPTISTSAKAVESSMSTVPVMPAPAPAPVAASKVNKLETFLSTAAKDVEKVLNVGINVVTAEQPLLNQLLPPQFSTAEGAATALIKNVMLHTEAKYAALGTNVPYAEKVAEVVAITGAALVQILAGIGVTAGQTELASLVTGATAFSSLQTSGLTTLKAPTASTETA
jgi:hypothetical protein